MTLSVDASSPVAVRDSSATTTTASFTPPGNSLLLAFVHGDANTGNLTEALTVSGGGLSWSLVKRHNGTPGATVEVWKAQAVTSPGSITVSVTDNQGSVAKSLFVRVFTDSTGATPDVGASNGAGGSSVSYTSTVANSWGWGVGLGAGLTGAGASQTLVDSVTAGGFDGGDDIWTVEQNATTTTPGTSVTMSVTVSTGAFHFAGVEIVPGGSTVTNYGGTGTDLGGGSGSWGSVSFATGPADGVYAVWTVP